MSLGVIATFVGDVGIFDAFADIGDGDFGGNDGGAAGIADGAGYVAEDGLSEWRGWSRRAVGDLL